VDRLPQDYLDSIRDFVANTDGTDRRHSVRVHDNRSRDRHVSHRANSTLMTVVKLPGLTNVRLHDLRRTVMTRAAAAGVGVHVLRDLLGHKTTAMADRYVRSVGSPVADAREAIGAGMAAAMAGGRAGE
jgi:integrase